MENSISSDMEERELLTCSIPDMAPPFDELLLTFMYALCMNLIKIIHHSYYIYLHTLAYTININISLCIRHTYITHL